jgi:hypothetical protein
MDGQGMRSHAVAVPFGNYGQLASNDPRVAPYVRGLLTRQFGVIFVQDPENDPGYTRAGGPTARYELHRGTSTDQLYMWLRDHSPAAERAARAAARKRAARRAAGERNLRR